MYDSVEIESKTGQIKMPRWKLWMWYYFARITTYKEGDERYVRLIFQFPHYLHRWYQLLTTPGIYDYWKAQRIDNKEWKNQMPIIEFSQKDLQRNRVITPGWYRAHIDSVGEWELSKNGTSQNCNLDGVIIKNADNGNEEFTGMPTPRWSFNDSPKARGFIEGFLNALKVEINPTAEKNVRIELKAAEGREIDVFIENETYEGRIVNRINHKYRTPKN